MLIKGDTKSLDNGSCEAKTQTLGEAQGAQKVG